MNARSRAHLFVLAVEKPLNVAYDDRGELVQPLADALEHDEAQRYADDRVEHGEELAAYRVRRRVPVACVCACVKCKMQRRFI